MKVRWLPDPGCYRHPWLSWLFACLFDTVLRGMFRVEHDMPRAFRMAAGTLVVSNHLRDADGPLIGTLLCDRRGVHVRGHLPYFALREDLFQREAMANLLHGLPVRLLRLVAGIRLGWFLDNARALPMRRVREFSLHDVLRELSRAGLGGADPAGVFNRRGQREMRQHLGELPSRVDAIDPWLLGPRRDAWWGLRRLSLSALRQLAPGFRRTVAEQLQRFAGLLDDGHTVYFAPEGSVSRDGRMGRIRAGTWRLVGMTATAPPVLFFVLSYDPFVTGRTRVIMRTHQWTRCPALDPGSLGAAIRVEIRRRRVVTPSHLLAWFIAHHPDSFGSGELVAWLERAVSLLPGDGPELDVLLSSGPAARLVDERLHWLRRKRIVRHRRGHWHNTWVADTAPGWKSVAAQVGYMANAFADMAPEAARRLVP